MGRVGRVKIALTVPPLATPVKFPRMSMAKFRITTAEGGERTVDLELTFNLNPLGKNTWRVIGGDSSILPVDHGTWNSAGLDNRVIIRDDSEHEVAFFDPIDVAVNLTDPFSNLRPGDSDAGSL